MICTVRTIPEIGDATISSMIFVRDMIRTRLTYSSTTAVVAVTDATRYYRIPGLNEHVSGMSYSKRL